MKLKEFNKNLKKEYNDTFHSPKPKRKFKLRYAFGLVFGCILLILLINHIYVLIYNGNAESYNNEIRDRYYEKEQMSTSSIVQITSPKEYQELVNLYRTNHTLRETKKSALSILFSFGAIGCSSSSPEDFTPPIVEAPSNSYQTNVQTDGIDEEDVAKCDGKYIYTIHANATLAIYNLKGEQVVSIPTNGNQLMIYENKIVVLGEFDISLYTFENESLKKEWSKSFDKFYTSRLKNEYLYAVIGIKNVEEEIDYTSCYYDSFSNLTYLYSILRINLKTLEVKQTQMISSSKVFCYMSDSAFYLGTPNNFLESTTVVSMYNIDLEPVGVMRVQGSLLNQFSMDEYEDNFRIVSTDTTQNAEEINRLTIFSIKEELMEVGCLKNGIGIGRQTVRSVRFNQTKCYIVTYETKDPLYEIDCSNPSSPTIISSYQAPGYSSYLHTFTIAEKEYVLGLGYTDSGVSTKISLYENTTQVGKDFILSSSSFYDNPSFVGDIDLNMFSNHKSLFFYQSDKTLYLGARIEYDSYMFLEIQVNNLIEPIRIIKKINIPSSNVNHSRAFVVEGKLYLTTAEGLQILDVNI